MNLDGGDCLFSVSCRVKTGMGENYLPSACPRAGHWSVSAAVFRERGHRLQGRSGPSGWRRIQSPRHGGCHSPIYPWHFSVQINVPCHFHRLILCPKAWISGSGAVRFGKLQLQLPFAELFPSHHGVRNPNRRVLLSYIRINALDQRSRAFPSTDPISVSI
jgi:hypothetical protein